MKIKKLLSTVLATAIALTSVSVTSLSAAADTTISGSCGDDATWLITNDGKLVISGSGSVTGTGWYSYRYDIEEVVIQEGITSARYDVLGTNSIPYVRKIILPTTFTNLKGMSSSFIFLKDIYVYSEELSKEDINYNWGTFPKASSGVKWHVYEGSGAESALRNCNAKYTDADIEYIEGDKPADQQYTAASISEQTETGGQSGVSSEWSWNEAEKTLVFSGTGSISINSGYSKYKTSVEKVVIGDGIKYIFPGAFSGFSALNSVSFSDSVTIIEDNAFINTKLTEFIAPANLVEIGDKAFYQVPISKIELNDKLERIGTSAFDQTLIESLEFKSGNVFVGQQAFSKTKIKDLVLCEGMRFGGTVFYGCNDLKEVTVPKGCTYDKNGEGNMMRANKLFSDCTGLEKVIVEDGAALAESMFINCSALKDVYLLSKTSSISILGPKNNSYNAMFEGTNDPIFHVYRESTAENALKAAGYVAADNANIIYLADTTALDSAIASAEAIDTTSYTEETVKILTDAIEAAKSILENIDAAQEDVDAAAKAIEDAIAGLAPNVIKGNLNGTILVSDKDTETEMTVTAKAADGTETTVTATSMGTYVFEGLVEGDYTLTVSGGKYVKRTYEIIVAEGENTQDVELNPCGDVNGDGKITTADVGMANSHAKGVNLLEGYKFDCANVKVDEAISTADVGMINSHAKSIKALW